MRSIRILDIEFFGSSFPFFLLLFGYDMSLHRCESTVCILNVQGEHCLKFKGVLTYSWLIFLARCIISFGEYGSALPHVLLSLFLLEGSPCLLAFAFCSSFRVRYGHLQQRCDTQHPELMEQWVSFRWTEDLGFRIRFLSCTHPLHLCLA